jgi:UTP-glucose-1-phosphate uridylyltransferase
MLGGLKRGMRGNCRKMIINPGIFEILEHTKPGKGGEIQLTDALKVLAQKELCMLIILRVEDMM